MEKLFMSAGVVTAIILCIVGILKLPFKNFKIKHPNWYKALFTILSFVLTVVLSILNELYILNGEILSIDCFILICAVSAGVFGGYSGIYEGLGLKELVKKLVFNIKQARTMTDNEKALKYLDKIDDIDNALRFLEEKKRNQTNNEV